MAEPFYCEGTESNKLAYDVLGASSAQPILLCHGGGQTRHAWRKTSQTLSDQHYCTISYDHRGHGQSDRVKSGDYRFAAFGADMGALVQSMQTGWNQKPIVVGASLGGLSALMTELNAPNTFAAIILVDIIPMMDMGGVARIQGFMRDNLEDGFASLEEAGETIARYLPNRTKRLDLSGLRKNLIARDNGRLYWHWDPLFVSGVKNINIDGVETMTMLDNRICEITCPICLIRGGTSELVDLKNAQNFIDKCQNGTMRDVSKAGHMVAGDRNDIFAAMLGEELSLICQK